jgi:hypothetical protein
MRSLLFLIAMNFFACPVFSQYVYTIKADTVKITNCDSAELVLQNHTQGVPGFLFNAGNGRTVFQRGAQSIGNGIYLVGADTIRTASNAWVQGGNAFGATGVLGTLDDNHLDLYTNDTARARLANTGNLLLGTTTDSGQKLQVAGNALVNGGLYFPVSTTTGTGTVFKDGFLYISCYNGDHSLGGDPANDNCAFFGRESGNLTNNSIGANCAMGYQAMQNFTTAYNNNAIGIQALQSLTTGYNNTGEGPYCLQTITTGSENTAIGTQALGNGLTTGSENTALGTYAGDQSTGSNNVFIGFQAGFWEQGSNKLYVANSATSTPLVYGDFSAASFTINGSQFVTGKTYMGGATSPTAVLQIAPGGSAAGSAPLKLTAGTNLSTPEDGAIEYDGTDYYVSEGTTRYKLVRALAGQITTNFSGVSLTSFQSVTTTLTITGAQPGNTVTVNSNAVPANPPGIIITAYISATNTVTVQAYNASNTTITLSTDTYNIKILP